MPVTPVRKSEKSHLARAKNKAPQCQKVVFQLCIYNACILLVTRVLHES